MTVKSFAYIGRLAPSPTGLLHLGHAATFWTAYQRAEVTRGTLLLRNEDLDRDRSRPEFVTAMLRDLRWLGITWQLPMVTQSERLPLYRAAMERLLQAGLAYPCTCSRRDLQQMMQAPHEDTDDEPVYTGNCRPSATSQSRPANQPHALVKPGLNYRFRVPDHHPVTFTDLHFGPQTYLPGTAPPAAFGDFLVWRKDGLPSYQLACVVDDDAMQVTEVVRGRDLLKSTARQILLQRALDLPTPAYFHTDLLRDDSGVRLAKRHDALAIHTLREAGHSPADVLSMFSNQP